MGNSENDTNTVERLTSPLIVAHTQETWRCLTFWYYVTGGQLTVDILEQQGDSPDDMTARQSWNVNNDTIKEWREFMTPYDINHYKQYKVTVFFLKHKTGLENKVEALKLQFKAEKIFL